MACEYRFMTVFRFDGHLAETGEVIQDGKAFHITEGIDARIHSRNGIGIVNREIVEYTLINAVSE